MLYVKQTPINQNYFLGKYRTEPFDGLMVYKAPRLRRRLQNTETVKHKCHPSDLTTNLQILIPRM